MKRLIAKALLAFASLLLAACAFKGNPYPNTDQTNETWPAYVQTSPNSWVKGASRWFLTGDANVIEQENMSAPSKMAVRTKKVRVSNFNKIKVDGPFQVQLFSTYENNSVFLYGPNAEVSQVAVDVQGGTLCIHVVEKDNGKVKPCKVIVRIGVANLCRLTQMGCGRIEGRQIRSMGLEIESAGSGKIFLAGDMKLRRITQNGDGTISVFGANTPSLDISTAKNGGVNVSGNIGLRNIIHAGSNDINIVGACGGCAKIYTEGRGKIGINGNVNIREITAKDSTCVFAYCVRSGSLYVCASGGSTVGLAGNTEDLYVDTSNNAQFYGRDLLVGSAYVRTYGSSHVNVTARSKIYAAANSYSSVYFFGSPNMLSPYQSGDGTILPVWFDRPSHYALCQGCPVVYKDVYKERSCAAPVYKMPPRKTACEKKTRWQQRH